MNTQLVTQKPVLLQGNITRKVSTPAQPAVQFAGNVQFGATEKSGGFMSGLKRFFSTFGAMFNFKSKEHRSKNAVAVLEQELDKIRADRQEQKDIRDTIVAEAKMAKQQFERLSQEKTVLENSADAALELFEEETDVELQNGFKAKLQKAEADLASKVEELGRAQQRLESLQLRADGAKAKDGELEVKMQELAQKVRDAQTRVRETAQNKRLAQVDEKLKALAGESIGTSELNDVLESVDREFFKSESAVEGNNETSGMIQDLKLQQKMREKEASKSADSAVEAARARRAAKQAAANGGQAAKTTETAANPIENAAG